MTVKNKYLAVIFLLFAFTACGNAEPERPGGIPAESFWVGGADGKVWVKLGELQQNKFYATIYRENGEQWASGWFVFTVNKDPYLLKNIDEAYLKKHMSGFDGSRVYVIDVTAGRSFVYVLQH